ncbi:MAG: MFS transporter [Candidatus Eremiobacteraeota bacterium]|nr:MFS transporter [Candidatus Eremiobacteraeota bacterium]
MNWRVQLGLALNLIVFATVLNSVGIVVERSISEWHIAKTVGGTLEGCKDLTIAFTSLLLASQVPKMGYRRVMMGGVAAVCAVCALLATVQQFWTVPILFIACGASFALVKVSVYATVGLFAKDSAQHASMMNRIEGIYQVGALVAPVVFAQMIARGNWINTYWFVAGLALLAFLTWVVTPLKPPDPEEAPPGTSSDKPKGAGGLKDVKLLLQRPLVLVFLLCAAVYVMIEQSIGTWLPSFNKDVLSLEPERAALMLSVYFGSLALSRFVFGYLVKRIPAFTLQLIYLACAFALLGAVLMTTAQNPWQGAAYLLVLVGFFIGPIYPTLNSMMLSQLDKSLHSSMTGLIIVASALGGTIGSQILGTISQHYTTHTAFHFPLLPIGTLAVLLILFHRLEKQ